MSERRSDSTLSFKAWLDSATHWAVLGESAKPPSLWVEDGKLIVGSTNGYGASWVCWPMQVEGYLACAVDRNALLRVRSIRGLVAFVKRSKANPSFNSFARASLERFIDLPDAAAFEIKRDELVRIATFLRGSFGFNTMIDALDWTLRIDGVSFDAHILLWKRRSPALFDRILLCALFGHVLGGSLRASIKSYKGMPVLYVRGESEGVVEHHMLAGLRAG